MSSLYLYDPFHEFDRLFDQAFDARLRPSATLQRHASPSGESVQTLRPRLDLHENAETNTVTAMFELPGLTKEDVHIEVHDGRLTVSAETKTATNHDEGGYAVRERRYGKIARTLHLPRGVKEEQIQAKMDHGILTITFPKGVPEVVVPPKKIPIA